MSDETIVADEATSQETAAPTAESKPNYVKVVADIVSAYVSNNAVRPQEMPDLIAAVHASISHFAIVTKEPETKLNLVPAVPIKKSVFPDYIICLEDGLRFASMRRHIGKLGMTPDEYRTKWGLATDYPMVSPNYAAQRSALAKASGLGARKAQDIPKPIKLRAKAPGKRGRPKKDAA